MEATEVWPNAPLALVAVEVRYLAGASGPVRPPVLRAIRELLGPGWVLEGQKLETVQVAFGSAGPHPPSVSVEEVTRITVRDRTRAVTVRSDSLTIEATSYAGYLDFRKLIVAAFDAVGRVLGPDGVKRLGMRYIDEIYIPSLSGSDPWDEWIDKSLLAPRAEGLSTRAWTSVVRYETGPDRHLVLRYGSADGPVVNPTGPLKRSKYPPAGPIFVLDFDSFWEPEDIPAFEPDVLSTRCDELRAPVRRLFDQLMSPRLVEDVFKMEGA